MGGGPLSRACRHSPEPSGGRTPFGVDSCIPTACWHAGGCWEKVLGQDVALGGSNVNWEVTAVTVFVIGQVEQGPQ